MRFPPDMLDEIRARIPMSQIVGRSVKLKRAGREFVGLCPFHADKKPSLGVNDQKDLWNCFPCGKNGDQFKWLMECEGVSFPDAVKELAEQAGVVLPQLDAETTKREARKLTLIEIVEEASAFFRKQLKTVPTVREYLTKRGIGPDMVERFGIGYAPEERSALKSHLAGIGVDSTDAIDAGLIVAGDDVPVSYDRFRGRVIFPIRDAKGRGVGFGGRALAADVAAKYLNSPEGQLFDKGRLLYNAHAARQPAQADDATVIAVEGYAGTIASVGAGFGATVASMGTALSEAQLIGLWRLSDCPVLAYDGDAAGRKATRRAIATALPMLTPGRKLKIASLPVGMDPDDVVRERGAQAYADAIGGAVKLVDSLWGFESAGRDLASPDDRAALEHDLIEAVKVIPDERLRDQYRREYRDRVKAIPTRRAKPLRSNSDSQHSITPASINLTRPPSNGGMTLRAAMLILAIVRAPAAALREAETLVADQRLVGEAGDVVRRALDILAELPEAATADLVAALDKQGVGASVAAALDLCHRNGIRSLDPEAGEEAATALLTRH